MANQFRCAFATDIYEETVGFYQDGLGLAIAESWDRAEYDKGTLFRAASGVIEVIRRSKDKSHGEWEAHRPQVFTIVIETENLDGLYKQMSQRNVTIIEDLKDQKWGHRSFRVSDPNGVQLYFYSEITAEQ